MKKQKCLVTEAMDKCQCEMCKLSRKFRDFHIDWIIKNEMIKLTGAGLQNAGIVK